MHQLTPNAVYLFGAYATERGLLVLQNYGNLSAPDDAISDSHCVINTCSAVMYTCWCKNGIKFTIEFGSDVNCIRRHTLQNSFCLRDNKNFDSVSITETSY